MLQDVISMDWTQFEEKYKKEAFYHQERLMRYKINHLHPQEIWNGDLKQKNYWVSGLAGTGKSYWARTRASPDKIFPKNCNKWWDGFSPSNHSVVVVEDFPRDGAPFTQLMKVWSDRYTFIGEVNGGQLSINPGKFFLIITSNYSIEDVFPGEDNVAIRRRFQEWNIQDRNDLRLQTTLDFGVLQGN